MSLDADAIVDRRRMRRKLTFWRVAAVAGRRSSPSVLGAVMLMPGSRRCSRAARHRADHDPGRHPRQSGPRRGARAARPSRAREAVIVHHRQPGRHHRRLRAALRRAARACRTRSRWWWWSTGWPPPAAISPRMASDHIFAHDTSLVGSIGVLFQFPNFTECSKTIGVKVEEVKSVAAQGRAERLRADQPGSARGDRGDRAGLL